MTAEIEKMLNNTKTQMRRGIIEMCILSIIAEEEIYPSDIIEKLRGTHMIIKEGTLYPLLTRLKNAGLLNYSWKESKVGPPRKYYHITSTGEEFLTDLKLTWGQLANAVNQSTKI